MTASNILVGRQALGNEVKLITRFYREGPYLHGVTTMVSHGNVEVFRSAVDLRPIAAFVRLYHDRLHGKEETVGFGFFSAVGNLVKKIGKVKILKNIGNGVKSVVKSKITGGITGALAVAFPPVGVPAAAAYASANAALSAIEKGTKAQKALEGIIRKDKKFSKTKSIVLKAPPNVRKRMLEASPTLRLNLQEGITRRKELRGILSGTTKVRAKERSPLDTLKATTITLHLMKEKGLDKKEKKRFKRLVQKEKVLSLGLKLAPARLSQYRKNFIAEYRENPNKTVKEALQKDTTVKAELEKALSRKKKVQGWFKKIASLSRAGDPEAKKTAEVIALVHKDRERKKAIKQSLGGGQAGFLIDPQGRILRGRFVDSKKKTSGVLLSNQKILRGSFSKVGTNVLL